MKQNPRDPSPTPLAACNVDIDREFVRCGGGSRRHVRVSLQATAAPAGNLAEARPMVRGKNAEQPSPARVKSAMPLTDPRTAGSSRQAPIIRSGSTRQSEAGATRSSRAELRSRPTAMAAQKADKARLAVIAGTPRSSCR